MMKLFGLIFCFISVINCVFLNKEEFEKSTRLCANPPVSCSCSSSRDDSDDSDEPLYIYSCFHNASQNQVVFEMQFFHSDWIHVKCLDVLSFKKFPEFTNSMIGTGIKLENCMVSKNETLFELTSKISKDIKHLEIEYQKPEDRQLIFNKYVFEGLSTLESLEIYKIDSLVLNIDVFENLVNLKEMTLSLVQTPDDIFDTLIQLRELLIRLEKEADLNVGVFKNQRNLVKMSLYCKSKKYLNPQIFANLTNLEQLIINGDFIITWPENMFEHNQKLKSFEVMLMKLELPLKLLAPTNLKLVLFNYCNLKQISEDFFKNSSNIEEINLSYNNMSSLPKDIFVDQIMLLKLNFQSNNLSKLTDGLFDTTVNMRTLLLSSNKLESISRYLFAKLEKLETLYLSNNKLVTIDDSFRRLVNLEEIYLGKNLLSHSNTSKLFEWLRNLKTIDLSKNKLEEFSISNTFYVNSLQDIDLSHNHLLYFDYGAWMISISEKKLKIDLSYNRINQFKVKDFLQFAMFNEPIQKAPLLHLIINNNPINCDCSAIDLVKFINNQIDLQNNNKIFDLSGNFLKCEEPNYLNDRLLTNLSTSELKCNIEKGCPNGCQCQQRPVDATIIFNCSSFKLLELPTLPNFTNINLTSIELYVNNNSIHSIQLTNVPVDLKLLDLRNNSLQYLEDTVIKRFESIDKLYLSDNPWTCDCQSVKFVNFYHIFRSIIDDADDMMCSDGRPFKTLEVQKLCIQLIELFLVFFIGISLMGLSSTFYLLYKKQIKMWLYAHNCFLWWMSEEEVDKDMIYDAFFIFSHSDDNFVTDLVLDFEQPPKSFKCCIHHRDWMPGEMIITQSLQSIKTSRRIIVVLSPMFLRSNWATWEFRVSLIHAFKERRSRVVVIIYGDPSVIDDLDEDLKTFVRFNTYLDSEDPWFDEKLLYAMPHRVYKPVENSTNLEEVNAEIQ